MFVYDRFYLIDVNIWKSLFLSFFDNFWALKSLSGITTDVSTRYKPKIEGKPKC
jgi:hypothetical protein